MHAEPGAGTSLLSLPHLDAAVADTSELAAALIDCVTTQSQAELVPHDRFGFPLNLDAHPDHIVISADPLIVQFNAFLSQDEVAEMRKLAEETGYERSGVGGLPDATIQSMARK